MTLPITRLFVYQSDAMSDKKYIMDRRAMRQILFVVFSALALTAIVFLLMQYTGRLTPAGDHSQEMLTESAKDFADGNGIYYYNDGKYNFLFWKKKLFTPGAAPVQSDIVEAAQSAIPVKKGIRFFSYGLDLSKWERVPPYAMAFCIIRDRQTVDGAYPIRIKLVKRTEPIYELVPPLLINTLTVPWAINFEYSCADGWVFKFQ